MKLASQERAVAFSEFAILLPILLVVFVAIVDIGRIVYFQQVVTNLSREAANIVSRGASTAEAFASIETADAPLDVTSAGRVIISTIRRRSPTRARAWVVEQVASGALHDVTSRVGVLGGPAAIPNLRQLPAGMTLRAVEVVHVFEPLLNGRGLGLDIYPSTVYDVAFF
jgi:Flp pilus assembly protein TadG